ISFSAGQPHFDTPEHIKKAATDALAKGQTKYAPASGLPALRKSIAAKFLRDNGLTYDPAQIVVSCGAKHSLYNVMQAILEEGDEAIIPAPYWVSYPAMVKCAGATPVIVTTQEKNGLKMTAEELRKAITERTKCLILCSPSNPTGMGHTAAELLAAAAVCIEWDLPRTSVEA